MIGEKQGIKMARKLQIEYQEEVDELKERYQMEKDHQNRTRLQAIWLVRTGKPMMVLIGQRKNIKLSILIWDMCGVFKRLKLAHAPNRPRKIRRLGKKGANSPITGMDRLVSTLCREEPFLSVL
ncbi:MAG: hypothetical protein U9Q82_13085 [Chloroflexota bacterium]|nr:hypothetical protein [Chloroflexota bacterium]